MWYWIIAGSIFIFLEVLAFLSLTPLKNKYKFFDFIHDCCADKSNDDISSFAYTIVTASIAIFFPLVIVFIVSYFIICFIDFAIKKLKRKN
jgi:ABC-type sulfate transport system permease component